MKKSIAVLLMLALVAVVFVGCGAPAQNPVVSPPPTASADPNAPLPGAKANPGDADKPDEDPVKDEEKPKEEAEGKSWYLTANSGVSGRIVGSQTVVPVDLWLVMALKNVAIKPGAGGTYHGTSYFEVTHNVNNATAGSKQYWTGTSNLNEYSIASEIPLNQLGQNVDYTSYSGNCSINFTSHRPLSVQVRDSDVAGTSNESSTISRSFKFTVLPNTSREAGMDVIIELLGPYFEVPPFSGKLYSSDEMNEEDYNEWERQIDEMIEDAKKSTEKKEGEEEGKKDKQQTEQQQIDDLNSAIKYLEEQVKKHENDDPSKYSKTEWEQREALYKQNMLELADKREQLAGLKQ